MREFGLIGYPLGHAYSQKYFTKKFKDLKIEDASYKLFPISEVSKVLNIINSHKNLIGLNVTTPYKELIIPFLDELDSPILKLGTVNTIKISRDGDEYFLKGFNTDVYGLRKTFDNLIIDKNSKALIFGSGGSGKTVRYVLSELEIECTNVSRNPQNLKLLSYSNLTESVIKQHKIIINASPVGMHPNVDNCPDIPYEFIGENHICLDLVYNPEKTLFLKKCEKQGAKCVNGLTMLYEQADKAWEIWNSTT